MKKKQGTKAPRVEQNLKFMLLYFIYFSFMQMLGLVYLGFLHPCGNHPFDIRATFSIWLWIFHFTHFLSLSFLLSTLLQKKKVQESYAPSLYSHSLVLFAVSLLKIIIIIIIFLPIPCYYHSHVMYFLSTTHHCFKLCY